jgi:hypothetical protein
VLLLRDVSLYSVAERRLKCNTGEVFNCLIQFLLTMVLSIEERVFVVEEAFPDSNRYTDLVQQQLDVKFSETPLLIVLQFVDLLRSFVKEAQCETPNDLGDHLNLTMRSCWTFLTLCCGAHPNHCSSWHKRKVSDLQQGVKQSKTI